jgi:hypothetical protein
MWRLFLIVFFHCFFLCSSYLSHRKDLGSIPLCTNILNTPLWQSQYLSLRRTPENFVNPTLNYSSPTVGLPCDSITIHSHDVIDEAMLLSVIEEYDSDESVRRIILTSATAPTAAATAAPGNHDDLIRLNQIIDQIITPRPWWRVVEHENHGTLLIHLDKIAREWEGHIRFIGSVQYPPPDICRETPLIHGNENCIHPGWGAVFGMLGNSYRSFPYAILGVYVSRSNDPKENTAFIKGSDCPTESNKWHCAFLPTTNCSFPSLITDCHSQNCIPPNNYDSITAYSHADRDGHLVDLRSSSDEIRLQFQTEIHSPLSKELASKRFFIHPQFKYLMPFNRTWYEIMKDDVHDAYAEYASYGHYILLRLNSWYRSQVSHYIRSYRATTTPYFHPNDECVAIHIRRGDRMTKYSMNEICYNASHEPKLCLDQNNQLHPCNVHDMWCGNVPFGLIELPRTLQYVEQILPPSSPSSATGSGSGSGSSSSSSSSSPRNILLLSDDYDWILQETEAIKNDPNSPYHHWNFYHPPPPSSLTNSKDKLEKYHMIRSEGGTASGVYLHSTFQMVSQCNGFIGHLGSSFTGLLFAIMCHRHRGLEGVCPPLFDIKWDKAYYDQKFAAYVAERERGKN